MPSPRRSRFELALFMAALLATALAGDAFARPTIRQSFFNVYTSAAGSRLDNLPSHATHCGACHYDFNGGGPRNPYGVRLGNVIGGYPNNDAGRQQAIRFIENEDSDTDGHSTLTEVTNTGSYSNTPTFPGLTSLNVGQTSNVPVLTEITPYLTPTTGADVTPPAVSLGAPNGGQSWIGGTAHAVTWTATDNVGVASIDLFYRDGAAARWTMMARGLGNGGSYTWFVHNTPTTAARVKVVAWDLAGNTGADSSDANFSIVATPGGIAPTTLRDFHQPGTQPFEGGSFQDRTACMNCHGNYDPAIEPGRNFSGSMMGEAMRDPLFIANLAIAEQDAPSSGDLCLRCHTPIGWMSGRSHPTDGSQLTALDRDGVSCDFCHRAVDPIYKPGVSPPEDQAVLAGLQPAHIPTGYTSGQYVVDPQPQRRGPFTDPVAPHPTLPSAFHRTGEFCGTCHDVSNPAFDRVSGADYAPGPFDQQATAFGSHQILPVERTYSEWKASAFPTGVYAPEFAGNKPDGIVSTCQDCHMRDVIGKGCNDPAAPMRQDLPLHDMTGGNAWLGPLIASLYPGETDGAALVDGAARAVSMLQKAATVNLAVNAEGDSGRAFVTVTNQSGHKLPTGYPEGRRMWLHVVARDGAHNVVYESGAYDAFTGILSSDPHPVVYEAELGLSPGLANALGLVPGPSFHFALNDTVYKDNRIPPLGFTSAAFAEFGGTPVDHEWPGPGPRYADGQNYDIASFAVPRATRSVTVELLYQTTSKPFIEFLRDENTTNGAGQTMYNLWAGNGRAAPVVMATTSESFTPVEVEPGPEPIEGLRVLSNPFRGALAMSLTIARPQPVRLAVYDARGRRVATRDRGRLPAGTHALGWDGRDQRGADVGVGMFWVRVEAGERVITKQVVRLK